MNKLTSNKKVQVLMLFLATGGVLACLWSFLILHQRQSIDSTVHEISLKQDELKGNKNNLALTLKIKEDLVKDQEILDEFESKMAQGDLLPWVIKVFGDVQRRHHVEFRDFDPPVPYDLDFYPAVPYKAASFSVVGTGFYQDWGLTLADFEENYPTCRLSHLILEPSGGANAGAGDAEKLTLRMEFIALIKPR